MAICGLLLCVIFIVQLLLGSWVKQQVEQALGEYGLSSDMEKLSVRLLGRSVKVSVEDFTAENLQRTVKGWITSNEIGFGKVMMPLRLALVGTLQGPDVFDIVYMIGKTETLKRIDDLISLS